MFMGGRLPAVTGMPAIRTFLELSAGQSDWPEKNCLVLLQKSAGVKVSMNTAADVIEWQAHTALRLAYLNGNY